MTDLPLPLPLPLSPPDCDLRGMPYMPLDLVRLFDSDFYALATGDEFKAGLTLWGKSFLQVPGGSLPDDQRILAHLSGAGAAWKKVRGMALRGWVKCSDGRLYHPVVAEKAAEAWRARLERRARTEAARAARQSVRGGRDRTPMPPVTTDATDTVACSVTENVTGSKGREGNGREEEGREEPPVAPPPPECRAEARPTNGVVDAEASRPRLTAKRGTRLPADWYPDAAGEAYATDRGVDPMAAAEEFRNYWQARSGHGAAKLDWPATFRNRVIELAERGRFPLRRNPAPSPTAANPTGRAITPLSGGF